MAGGDEFFRIFQSSGAESFRFDAAGEKPVGVRFDFLSLVKYLLQGFLDIFRQQFMAEFIEPEGFVALDVFEEGGFGDGGHGN